MNIKAFSSAIVLISAAVAAGSITASPTVAQCAGCGADVNKADREHAKEQADKNDRVDRNDHTGNGTLHDAGSKALDHEKANDKAFHESDPN